MQNPRYLTFKALCRVESDGAYSNITLDSFLKNSELEPRDSAFAASLFYGVLEKRLSLDYIISKFSSIRLKKIETKTLIILRMGVFQMVFMDKVPDSAAVNESVKICKKERLYQSSGFVNGLLRSVARAEERFPLPDRSNAEKYLSVKYSCPENIVSLWIKDYSAECAENILKSLSGRPPIFAKVNTLKIRRDKLIEKLKCEGVEAKAVDCLDTALELKFSGSVSELDSFKKGYLHIQDLSSQLCCELLSPKEGDIISDVCSAPGGKAFNLAERMNGSGSVHCYDIHEHKLNLIRSSADRLGIDNIVVKQRDALSDAPIEMSDRILCDVPCSGLGILRRKPEIRYKSDTGVDSLPDIQYKILENSAKYLKKGGVLVYSTCTLHRAENGDIVSDFLSKHADFEPYELSLPKGIERTIDEPGNMLTLFPQTNNTDGFFISAVKKR